VYDHGGAFPGADACPRANNFQKGLGIEKGKRKKETYMALQLSNAYGPI
jgi:hypothetical protein